MIKLITLRGPNYGVSNEWQTVSDPQGRFAADVPGPGIYVVEARADGFAPTRSEPINADKLPRKEIRITLSRGSSLSGTVVDEEGGLIDGATVISLASAGAWYPVSFTEIPGEIGVKAAGGRFQIEGLAPGKDWLYTVHPNYAPTVLNNVEIRSDGRQKPLTIVMQHGGTVCGHVHDDLGRLVAGATLYFQDGLYGSDERRGRLATAITDENGYYEAKHLPSQVVYLHRVQEWETLGVVRQAVLPANGKVRTVDFGGSSKVAGRLFVNGKPLVHTRLLLAGEVPHSGLMRAYTMTDAEGSFVFLGIPFGERFLYYPATDRANQWVRVRALRIDSTARNFGRIDHAVGKLTVNWKGPTDLGKNVLSVSLAYETSGPLKRQNAGLLAPRPGKDDPYVFENVAAGKYSLTARVNGRFSVRRIVELAPGQLDQTLTLDLPTGKAVIRGTIEKGLLDWMGYGQFELRAQDDRLALDINVKEDGTFERAGIPAGDYVLRIFRWIPDGQSNLGMTVQFSLRDGQTKTVDFRKASLRPSMVPNYGAVYVSAFTPEGVPLPGCNLRLIGPKGPLEGQPSYGGRLLFAGEPGPYTISAEFVGFKPLTEQIELKPLDSQRTNTLHHELNVTLMPD